MQLSHLNTYNVLIPVLYSGASAAPAPAAGVAAGFLRSPARPQPDVGAGAAPHPASPAGDKTVPLAVCEARFAKINTHFHVFK